MPKGIRNEAIEDLCLPLPPRIPLSQVSLKVALKGALKVALTGGPAAGGRGED